MDLYFAPLSCSLASRIALYETGQPAGFHEVVLSTKQTKTGRDYRAVNPKGQVPALVLDDGAVLTEGVAILQYLADRKPEAGLAPPAGSFARSELQQWLNYVATEVHKAVFAMLFNPAVPAEMKTFAREVLLPVRMDYLSDVLAAQPQLVGGAFTVADAYLFTALNWLAPAGVELARWPVLAAWHARQLQRPAVARALADELALRQAA